MMEQTDLNSSSKRKNYCLTWQVILQKLYEYSSICEMCLRPHICKTTQKMKNNIQIRMAQEIE